MVLYALSTVYNVADKSKVNQSDVMTLTSSKGRECSPVLGQELSKGAPVMLTAAIDIIDI